MGQLLTEFLLLYGMAIIRTGVSAFLAILTVLVGLVLAMADARVSRVTLTPPVFWV